MNQALQMNESGKWKELYKQTQDLPLGSMLSFGQLIEMASAPKTQVRQMIPRMNKELLKTHKKMLINVRNTGYKVGSPEEQLIHGEGRKLRAKRQLDKGVLELVNLDTVALSNDEKVRLTHMLNRYQSALGIIRKRNVESLNLTKKAVESQEQGLTTIDSIVSRLAELEKKLNK